MEISDDRLGGLWGEDLCGGFGILHLLLNWVKTAVWGRGEMAGRKLGGFRRGKAVRDTGSSFTQDT